MNGGYALDPEILYKIRKMQSLMGRNLTSEEIRNLATGSLSEQAQRKLAGVSAATSEEVGAKRLELGGRELTLLEKQLEQEKLTSTISGVSGLATLGLTGKMLGKELGLWGGTKAIPGALPTKTIGTSLVEGALGVEAAPVIPMAAPEVLAAPVTAAAEAGAATTTELATAGAAMPQFVLPLAITAGIALLFSKIFK